MDLSDRAAWPSLAAAGAGAQKAAAQKAAAQKAPRNIPKMNKRFPEAGTAAARRDKVPEAGKALLHGALSADAPPAEQGSRAEQAIRLASRFDATLLSLQTTVYEGREVGQWGWDPDEREYTLKYGQTNIWSKWEYYDGSSRDDDCALSSDKLTLTVNKTQSHSTLKLYKDWLKID